MRDRLQKFIDSEGLSAAKFAEKMKVGAPNVSHLLSGRNKPGFDFIAKMLTKFPNLNPDWILLGTGNIYRNGSIRPDTGNETLETSGIALEKSGQEQNRDKNTPAEYAFFKGKGDKAKSSVSEIHGSYSTLPAEKRPAQTTVSHNNSRGNSDDRTAADSEQRMVRDGVTATGDSVKTHLPTDNKIVADCVSDQLYSAAPVNEHQNKRQTSKIEKVIMFYNDDTFEYYTPRNS
ncbi:hypothetical protein FACS1894159_05830 [Bacteroidia bacterium]|nr:hypothetical protein FACS1894159_05830 [Bacteroidia bacterium]